MSVFRPILAVFKGLSGCGRGNNSLVFGWFSLVFTKRQGMEDQGLGPSRRSQCQKVLAAQIKEEHLNLPNSCGEGLHAGEVSE